MPRLLGPWPVRVDEGQFYLAPEGDFTDIPAKRAEHALDRAYDGDGLLGTAEDVACVLTGINSGAVLLSALLVDKDPGHDPGVWDDIATTELVSPRGDFRDSALMGERGDINLAHAGPGTYGLRLHARGRDADPDGVQDEDEPITERYLLQVWPSR